MGMLERIKKRQMDGFKEFVISMETTSPLVRGQIFTAGVLEDPIYMGWVMKNIRTFDDFLKLPSDEIERVLSAQEQTLTVFAKYLKASDASLIVSMESVIPKHMARLKDEISYIKEVTPLEKEGSKYYILKIVRKFQTEESIIGFRWNSPPQDIFYPKTHKDGKVVIHFENGVTAAQGDYTKNKRIGPWRHFYDTGNLLAEGEYLEGHKTGMWVFYYSNGALKSQGKYKDDLKHGQWHEFDRTGQKTIADYNMGAKS